MPKLYSPFPLFNIVRYNTLAVEIEHFYSVLLGEGGGEGRGIFTDTIYYNSSIRLVQMALSIILGMSGVTNLL